jgi:hypothetical protein
MIFHAAEDNLDSHAKLHAACKPRAPAPESLDILSLNRSLSVDLNLSRADSSFTIGTEIHENKNLLRRSVHRERSVRQPSLSDRPKVCAGRRVSRTLGSQVSLITNARATHHRLLTGRRRQWSSTCARVEVCPSPWRRPSKSPNPLSALFDNLSPYSGIL